MSKVLLIDLDGTIRETISGKLFISEPSDQKLIDGASAALRYCVSQGWAIAGITNQGGVMHGYKTLEAMLLEQEITLDLCPQLAFVLACANNGESCWHIWRGGRQEIVNGKQRFCKPDPGMAQYALSLLGTGYPSSDEIQVVGDRPEDKEMAQRLRVPFTWTLNWRR